MKLIYCLLSVVIPLTFTNCAGIPGESPEHMRERMARQDVLVERHQEKRQIRSQAADERYEKSWNRAMGRSDSGW